MKQLLIKILLFCLPLILVTIGYIISDPYQDMPFHQLHAFDIQMLSRGDISTKLYLRNEPKYHYDSFIFGSSRATAHTARDWSKYLPKNSVPFSYGAWDECVEGMYRKMNMIDSLKGHINNAFFVFDLDYSFTSGKITGDYYIITRAPKWNYYIDHYINYLHDPNMMLTSIDYKIFHKQRSYMDGFVGMTANDWDPVNNDFEVNSESKIKADSVGYYKNTLGKFYDRPVVQQFSSPQIKSAQLASLQHIMALLQKHQTRYKIVIAPLYNQLKLNPADRATLDAVFGQENIYDYSGINTITPNKFNYDFDVMHYRKKVGNFIFKKVYSRRE